MKRGRENTEKDMEDGKKKCVTRRSRKSSSHSEQRSGVVTVGASSASASFKPMSTTPPPPPLPPPPPTTPPPPRLHNAPSPPSYLIRLRKLAFEALMSSMTIPNLVDHVRKKFLTEATSCSWEEECESVVTLLYVAAHYPTAITPLFAKEVVAEFVGRWIADHEDADISCASALFTKYGKYANFSIFLLLLGNLIAHDVDATHLNECVGWSSKWSEGTGTPDWLLDASGCKGNLMSLSNLLFASSMMLKGIPCSVQCTGDFAGAITYFLVACRLYKEADYVRALARLQDIDNDKCSNDLQGWILWLTGLGLLKLGKPHTALIKLQAAVDTSDSCIPAIFNISQIFNNLGIGAAELESLSLLSVSGENWQPYATTNLQSCVLRLHHPPPEDLLCRALYMLSARCLRLKMYTESCNNVTSLLQKLENRFGSPSLNHQTLFRAEDDIPDLPSYERILLLQALAYFQNEDYQNTLTTLIISHLEEKKKDLRQFDYYKDSENEKMDCITTATACLIKSEALLKLDKLVDALQECVRLEQELSWVRRISNTGWELCILILKTLLYLTLSELHDIKKNPQNHSHYKCLASQNLRLLPKDTRSTEPLWEDLTLSNRLIMDNIYYILNEKLSTVV